MTRSLNTVTKPVIGYRHLKGLDPTPISAITAQSDKVMYFGDTGYYGYPDFPPNRDVGGLFRLIGTEIVKDVQECGELWRGGINDEYYSGSLVFAAKTPFVTIGQTTFDPSSRAAEAFKKMKPVKPEFSALNSLYELREVPDLIWLLKGKLKNAKDLGKLHLTGQFGILPLLSDAKKLLNLQQKVEKRMNQLLRDNGRRVRRKVILQDESSDPEVLASNYNVGSTGVSPSFVTQYYSQLPLATYTQYIQQRWWATAQFRYWLPAGPRDIAYKNKLKRYLWGLSTPTASQLYNAIPWSWLIDWFSNLGDVIDNLDITIADRVAADRCYIMREYTNRIVTDTSVGFYRRDGSKVKFRGTSVSTRLSKNRVKGDPFGFHTKESSLSGVQLSIMGALGLSKLL